MQGEICSLMDTEDHIVSLLQFQNKPRTCYVLDLQQILEISKMGTSSKPVSYDAHETILITPMVR